MDPILTKILSGLRNDTPSQGDMAAVENMRALVPEKGCDPQDLLRFLETAADVRLAQARKENILPATFYAWYDEQAGQLRFSLVPGRADTLPFRAPVDLVTTPSEIIRDALTTWTPGFVSHEELTEVEWSEPTESADHIRVWARTAEDPV